MTRFLPLPRSFVALACLCALVGVGHQGVGPGASPDGGATAGGQPPESGPPAPLPAPPAMAGSSTGPFFGAPVSAGHLPPLLNRGFSERPGSAAAEDVRESAGATPAGPGFVGAPFPTLAGGAQSRSRRPDEYYDFYFTRAVYGGGGLGRGFFGRGSWAVDYPKADRQFLVVLGETLDLLRVPSMENAVRLEDPNLRRYPFLYTLEVGGMYLSQPQVEGLRNYLLAGGFLVVDDFWGAWEWRNFEEQMRRVFPGVEFVDLPLDHEIFHVFYDIEEILQVPNIGNAQRGVTSECGPCQPRVRGIFDDEGRLMVVVNWNTDLGDAWEWSEQAVYPFRYSNFAYKMAVNFIVYAMTH